MPAGKRPTKRDAQAAVAARLGNYQAKVPKRTALVGHSDGSTINVTGKPDYVYARIRGDDRAQVEVLNYHGALAYDMPVKMELVTLDNEKKVWAITGIDRSFFVDTGGWGGAGNVGSHRESHEWPDQAPGPDAINVYARAIAPLRGYSIAGAGLRVYVNSAILTAYVGNGVYIYTGGSVLIASGDLPTTAGQIRIILISLDISDPDNPSLTKTLGDPILALETAEPEEPDFPADEIPVCAVLVRDDHTQLEEIDIYDRRKLVTGNVKLSALTSPDGTLTPLSVDDNGDVTIADGDLIFGTAATISSAGAITLDATGLIDILGGSNNTSGLRIRGSTPATEIVDLFVGSTGIFYVDFTNNGASAPYMEIRPTDNEYGLKIIAPGAAATFLNMFVVDATVDYANLTVGAVGGTDGLFIAKGGNIGVNTPTIPHGGIGAAMLALDGANASAAGPHVQFTTVTDDYPVYQQLNWAHDNIQWLFDAYFNGTNWFSSDAGSNIRVLKGSDSFRFDYASGIAQGSAITWSNGITLNPLNGRVGIGVTSPAGKTHIDQASTTAAIPVLYLDQADLSEEFIEFAATVGAGNPIDTAAIGTYYGKVRVSVAGVGFKYMALYNS